MLTTKRKHTKHNTKYFNRYREEILNTKFGRLQPIEYLNTIKKHGHKLSQWKCKCDCGNECVTDSGLLRKGKSSCGCLEKECKGRKNSKSPCWGGYKEISKTYWSSVKTRAMERNIKFNISIEETWAIFLKQNGKCALSGVEIDFGESVIGRTQTASLDRIDSNLEYKKDNIQWVHKDINKMKMDFVQKEFIKWCERITNYQNNIPKTELAQEKVIDIEEIK